MADKFDPNSPAYWQYIATLVHRVLAQHAPFERCDECPPRGELDQLVAATPPKTEGDEQ
jgi:hypothetical protein